MCLIAKQVYCSMPIVLCCILRCTSMYQSQQQPQCISFMHVMQKMREDNRASSFVMPPADFSVSSSSVSAKSGVGSEQLSAITAALEALQSSMMAMMTAPNTATAVADSAQVAADAHAQ